MAASSWPLRGSQRVIRRSVNTPRTLVRCDSFVTRFTLSSSSKRTRERRFAPSPISRTIWQAALSLTTMATSKRQTTCQSTRIDSLVRSIALPSLDSKALTSRRSEARMRFDARTRLVGERIFRKGYVCTFVRFSLYCIYVCTYIYTIISTS